MLSFFAANAAIVMLGLSVATSHWSTRENSKLHIYEGLFKKCIYRKITDVLRCKPLYDGDFPPDKLFVTIAALAATAFFHVFIFFTSIFLMCNKMKFYKKTDVALAVLEFFALLCSLTGVIVYTIHYKSNYYRLQYSYAICWGGVLLYFASLILTIIHIDKSGKQAAGKTVRYSHQGYWRSDSRSSSGRGSVK